MSKNIIKFSYYRSKIVKSITESLEKYPIINEGELELIPFFMNIPLSSEIPNETIIGGTTVPAIGIVGSSGRIYTYALKVLLSDIKDIVDM